MIEELPFEAVDESSRSNLNDNKIIDSLEAEAKRAEIFLFDHIHRATTHNLELSGTAIMSRSLSEFESPTHTPSIPTTYFSFLLRGSDYTVIGSKAVRRQGPGLLEKNKESRFSLPIKIIAEVIPRCGSLDVVYK